MTKLKPLVLLFGWLGSSERHLSKYVDVYESFGTKVVLIKPSLSETAIPSVGENASIQCMKYRLQPILEAFKEGRDGVTVGPTGFLSDSHNRPRPVFMHTMSNAGWIAMGTLFYMEKAFKDMSTGCYTPEDRRLLDTWEWMRENMAGIILDSCPSFAQPHIWAKGFTSAMMQTSSKDIEETHPWALSLADSMSQKYFDSPDVLKRFRRVRESWSHDVPRVPQLYLYSSEDSLIPSSHVETFMEQQQALGSPVTSQRWDDSGHCEHLKKHPVQYRRLVQSFVQHCTDDSYSIVENWV